jgi:hypothetical protein
MPEINVVNRGRRLMAAAFSSSERTRENMLKTRKTVSDLESGYPVVNHLSEVLENIISKNLVIDALWVKPESLVDRVLLSFARALKRDGLAAVVKRSVCKVIFDDELGSYRIAEPDELKNALDGVVKVWDASPALVQMYST